MTNVRESSHSPLYTFLSTCWRQRDWVLETMKCTPNSCSCTAKGFDFPYLGVLTKVLLQLHVGSKSVSPSTSFGSALGKPKGKYSCFGTPITESKVPQRLAKPMQSSVD